MLSADMDLAPIPLRAAAFVLDSVILVVLVLTVGSFALASGVRLGAVLPLMIVVAAGYNIGFVAGTGATPGKTALGLRIADRRLARPRPDAGHH